MEIGDKFNRLTAVRFVDRNERKELRWLFKCDCGLDRVIVARSVKSGHTSSCGCKGIPAVSSSLNKYCGACKTEKPLSEFYVDRQGRKDSNCRDCVGERNRRYFLKRKAADPNYNRPTKECAAQYQLKRFSNKQMRVGVIFTVAKLSARKRGIPFILLKSDFQNALEKQEWKCAQTGIPFELTAGKGFRPFGPSIDRINSARGYEPGNIQFVCFMYNIAKNKFDDADVLIFAHALIEHQRKPAINKLQLRVVS